MINQLGTIQKNLKETQARLEAMEKGAVSACNQFNKVLPDLLSMKDVGLMATQHSTPEGFQILLTMQFPIPYPPGMQQIRIGSVCRDAIPDQETAFKEVTAEIVTQINTVGSPLLCLIASLRVAERLESEEHQKSKFKPFDGPGKGIIKP